MSKNQKKKEKIGKFTYTAKNKLPKNPRVQTSWALSKLYYSSHTDPNIEKDIKAAEHEYRQFAKKHRAKDFISTPKKLVVALRGLEKIANMTELSKPRRYFSLRYALNAKDSVAEKQGVLIGNRMKRAANETLFFTLEIGKLTKKKQEEFLRSKELVPYRYFLKRIFLESEHDLSEPEEKIMNLKSGPSYGMWVNATEKIVSNRTIEFKKDTYPLNEAIELIDSLPSKVKPILWNIIVTEMEKIGEFAENEFTAILNDAKTDDELRSYKKPYSATLLAYEDDEKSIESLIEAVSTKGFELSRAFYKQKAKYHGVKRLEYSQKYDSIGDAAHIPFTQAIEICRDVFYGLKNEYGSIFDTMLKNGQIDVFPKKGKRGGAFMSGATNLPTHVFLNHTNTFKSLETLAHEMGHAIHTERSKKLPIFYQDHSITTAETASTLFENLVFDAVLEASDEKQKGILLHDRITRDIATIQRQIAFFNTELEMHQSVREQGTITNAELAGILEKHLRSYLGTAVNVTKKDGYSYVYVSHFRYGFYVYTYTFGILMSTIMANRYKADNSYIKEIDTFLQSGRKDTVANIFKEIGIDTTKPDVFNDALSTIEKDIQAFKQYSNVK